MDGFASTEQHPRSDEVAAVYSPYAVDWRFLPGPALVAKDCLRHHLVRPLNRAATHPQLSSLWRRTFGAGVLRSILAAKILFIHVTKAGGTSISKCLYDRNLPHYTAQFHHRAFGAQIAGLPSFAIIRHPVDRALSAYEFLRRGGSEVMACDFYDRWQMGAITSFEAVVERLHANRRDLSALPSAFHEQCGFILDDRDRVMVDRLFALERVRGLPPELGRWLGVQVIPHLNSTRPEPRQIPRSTLQKIEEIYGRDLALYEDLISGGGVRDLRGLARPGPCRPAVTVDRRERRTASGPHS